MCIYLYIYMRGCLCVCAYVQECVCVYVYVCVSLCRCACVRTRARVCVCERERERALDVWISHLACTMFKREQVFTFTCPPLSCAPREQVFTFTSQDINKSGHSQVRTFTSPPLSSQHWYGAPDLAHQIKMKLNVFCTHSQSSPKKPMHVFRENLRCAEFRKFPTTESQDELRERGKREHARARERESAHG